MNDHPDSSNPHAGEHLLSVDETVFAEGRTLPLGRRSPAEKSAVAELVRRYQSGDPDALEELHDALGPIILGTLRPYRTAALPPMMTFQDVTQQSWVVLAELAARWRPSGSFIAYFFHSFPQAIRRYVRGSGRASRQAQVISVPYEELIEACDRASSGRDESTTLFLAEEINALPTGQRAALLLHTVEGRDFDAIGRGLGVGREQALQLYQRAVSTLSKAEGIDRADESTRGRKTSRRDSDAEDVRFIRALHALASPGRRVPGRGRIALATGIRRERFTELMTELEAAGAVVDRRPTQSGRLTEPSAAETLNRLLSYRLSKGWGCAAMTAGPALPDTTVARTAPRNTKYSEPLISRCDAWSVS